MTLEVHGWLSKSAKFFKTEAEVLYEDSKNDLLDELKEEFGVGSIPHPYEIVAYIIKNYNLTKK